MPVPPLAASLLALAVCLAACGGPSAQLHSDAEKALSITQEADLTARDAAAGTLTAPYVSARTDEIAGDAVAAAQALEQDQGHDGDRRALAADLRAVATAVRRLDGRRTAELAQDAQRRESRL